MNLATALEINADGAAELQARLRRSWLCRRRDRHTLPEDVSQANLNSCLP